MKQYCKKNQFYVIACLIILSTSNCHKKHEDPLHENLGFFSLGEAKDFLLFKQGTWWVYKNSYTNELDTMELAFCELDTVHAESEKRSFDYENISFYINSIRDQAFYYTYCRGMNPEVLDFQAAWGFECNRIGGFYKSSGIACQFYYPFVNGNLSNGVYSTKFIEKKDSININGNAYHNIVSFSVTHDGAYPYPNKYILNLGNSRYYWAKNFGLIKIEHQSWDAPNNGNQVFMNWELIESHIYK